MEQQYFYQYAIAGLKNGKWYREHPNFITLELAQKHIKTDRSNFKRYEKLKIQRRQISKWEDVYAEEQYIPLSKPVIIKAEDIEPATEKMRKEQEKFYEELSDKVGNYLNKKEEK